MHSKNIKQVEQDLQILLDEVGMDDFPRAKALYMKDVEIMDAEGNPIDLEDVDVEIAVKMEDEDHDKAEHEEEEEKAMHEEEEKAEEEDEEKSFGKSEHDDNGEAAPDPRRGRLGISLGMRRGSGAGAGKPADRRGEGSLGGGLGGGRGGGRSMDVESTVAKAVDQALNTNIKNKGFDMRIDNDREGLVRWGSLKHLSNKTSKDPELDAYRFGRWAAACMGHRKSMDWCADKGIQVKAHLETVNSQGGFLVPDEFSNVLISLREQYGVFRRNAKIEPMTSDTKRIPKRSATLSASFAGEATAGTESTQTFQQVNLIAKKLMVLTTISNELNEDSLVNLGDSVAGEIAYAFAKKEDECGFIGDGTSTYGGIVGAVEALNAVASNAGIATGTGGNLISELTLDDIHDLMSKLPVYADTPNCKWYMHKSVFSAGLERLVYGSGGVTARERSIGALGTTLFGYPVEFTQVLATSATTDGTSSDVTLKYPILFGDLSLAAAMGDRRDNTIAFSDSALNAFEQDEIVVRGTERFDINFHTPGTSSEAGPLVALKMKAS
jgi:HK97 family phage major capsid protein